MSASAVSVLMSAYNAELYIEGAIESILNQTFSDFEFIIIDDASTDNTLKRIKKFNDKRIKILRNEKNLTLAASLNRGLRIAQGKFIARMDADDISSLQRIEKLYNFLEKNPDIDICGTYLEVFGSESGLWKYYTKDEEIKANLIWNSAMPHAAVMMRRETILKYNLFYDESETFYAIEDWKFWCDAKNFVRFANISESLYLYRREGQNIRNQPFARSKNDIMIRYALKNFGIAFTEYEFNLHKLILGTFNLTPSPETIKDAQKWLNKLFKHNKNIQIYPHAVFGKINKQLWNQLFYYLVPYGHRAVFAYFSVTGISWNHFIYYLKYSVNKITDRKK